MSEFLVQIIFGWPTIILSMLVSAAGFLKKWPWMLVAGGLLCAPFSFYLYGFTTLHYFAFLLPFFHFGAAWAIRGKRKALAWVLLLPQVIVMAVLATMVLAQ